SDWSSDVCSSDLDLRAMKSGMIPSFFDIAQHATKMATLPASVAMFVREDVKTDPYFSMPTVTLNDVLEQIRKSGPGVNAYQFGGGLFDHRVSLRLVETAKPSSGVYQRDSSGESGVGWGNY